MLLQAESDGSCTFSRAIGNSGRRSSSPGSHLLHLPLPAPGSPACGGAQPGFKGLKTLQSAPHMSPGRALLRTCPKALYNQLRQPLGDGGEPVFPPKRTFFFFPHDSPQPGHIQPRIPAACGPPRPFWGLPRSCEGLPLGSDPRQPRGGFTSAPEPPTHRHRARGGGDEDADHHLHLISGDTGTRGRDGAGHRLRRLLPPSPGSP